MSKKPQGTLAGVYKLWALEIPSLAIVPGFPVEVTGPATNDPRRYFIGGTMLQVRILYDTAQTKFDVSIETWSCHDWR